MDTGDLWKKHFRGSRYNFSREKGVYYMLPRKLDLIPTEDEYSDLLEQLLSLKSTGGRFYVTEDRDVLIAKKGYVGGRKGWYPYYVCHLNDDLRFKDIELNPENLQPGDVWTGLTHHHGSKYSLGSYKRYFLFWRLRKSDSINHFATNHPQLIDLLRNYEWRGGSFRINENKKIWKSIGKQTLTKKNIETIKELPSTVSKLIKLWFEDTQQIPIYIGEFHDQIELLDFEGPSRLVYEEEL